MTSLRNKILTSYGLSIIALLVFVAVVIADLHYLQTQIVEGEAVNTFYEASQEIRRHEKNLFLYHDMNDLQQLQRQIDAAQKTLSEGQRVFTEIASAAELRRIDDVLKQYSTQLKQYAALSDAKRNSKQQAIRALGHELSKLTLDFNQRQRAIHAQTTRVAVWTLMAASITVILIGLASAMFMVRRIVRPLALLEKQLDELAEGNEKTLTLTSQDKEIQSFVHHFNTMLERLRAQQNQLRHHEKAAALGVLVSGVAHELNNPLSNISTSVQLLLEDDTTREDLRRQWLSHVDGECERARRIVRRLLDSVRQPTHELQVISAPRLVQLAVLLIHRQMPPTLLLHIEDIDEGILRVDRERMQQVFINLIKNANDAGASNIWIVGRETTWEDSKPVDTDNLAGEITEISQCAQVMLIHIDDDGPGISPDHLTKVFDPFFTTQSGGEGTGLGLYLVEEIISEHGGCIAVENRDEGGTRFSIWLPLEPQQPVEQEAS